MTTSRRPALELEPLGARILPSLAPLPIHLPPVPAAAALVQESAAATHLLEGSGHGTYTGERVISGAGQQYQFNGTADLAGMGRVTVTGSLSGVGFIQKGRAHGFLTFKNAQGSVTLEIFGPPQAAFSPLPDHFVYNVIGRTGAFAHLSAKGALTLDLRALPAGVQQAPHGTFSLAVGSPKPPGSL